MLVHKPTNKTFDNRLEAKREMGHSNFNKAVHNNEFVFISK